MSRIEVPSNEHIKQMVDRFLSWRLPDNFNPDGRVRFEPPTERQLWPTGTNLFDAQQAETMIRYLFSPAETEVPGLDEVIEAVIAHLTTGGPGLEPARRKLEAYRRGQRSPETKG